MVDMAAKKNRNRAVTLIELVIVISIVGALTAASSMYIKETMGLWQYANFRSELVLQARLALMRMAREIRQIGSYSSVLTANSGTLEFIDMSNNNIKYQLVSGNLMRNTDILAGRVSALTFTYYSATNGVIATPKVSPNDTDIHTIGITLQVASGTQSKTISLKVFPRNLY